MNSHRYLVKVRDNFTQFEPPQCYVDLIEKYAEDAKHFAIQVSQKEKKLEYLKKEDVTPKSVKHAVKLSASDTTKKIFATELTDLERQFEEQKAKNEKSLKELIIKSIKYDIEALKALAFEKDNELQQILTKACYNAWQEMDNKKAVTLETFQTLVEKHVNLDSVTNFNYFAALAQYCLMLYSDKKFKSDSDYLLKKQIDLATKSLKEAAINLAKEDEIQAATEEKVEDLVAREVQKQTKTLLRKATEAGAKAAKKSENSRSSKNESSTKNSQVSGDGATSGRKKPQNQKTWAERTRMTGTKNSSEEKRNPKKQDRTPPPATQRNSKDVKRYKADAKQAENRSEWRTVTKRGKHS